MEICERVLNFSVCFPRFLSVLWGVTPYFCCEKRNGLSELAFERVTCQKNYKGEICPTIRNANKKHKLNSQVMACVSNLNKIKITKNTITENKTTKTNSENEIKNEKRKTKNEKQIIPA